MASINKSVLVCLGDRKREVSLSREWKAFMEALHCTFADVLPGSSSGKLIVQIKSRNWEGEFVDLPQNSQITHHSVLRIVPEIESHKVCSFKIFTSIFYCLNQGEGLAQKGSSLCQKMGKPPVDAKESLSKLFPGSNIGGGCRKRAFDPQSESLVLSNQRKKKAGIKSVRQVTREVLLLSDYTPKIPKGKFRTEMKRIKSLQFTRIMTPKEVSQ